MGAGISTAVSNIIPGSVAGSEDQFVVDRAITGAYAGAMANEAGRERQGGADGGCGCENKVLGGADGSKLDLSEASEYVDSINSKSKTRIIESILEAAAKLNLKPEGKSSAERIKSLLAQIPAGDRFKRDDKVQEGVCRNIAKAINAAYGVKVVEDQLPADALCQHIAEILSSLGTGVHTEFLAVYNDVQKVLHNLRLLEEQLVVNMSQIKEKATRCEDGVTAKNLQLNYDLQDMLLQETKRQIQLLSNLLNVHLMPTASDLSKLLKDKKELHGWIKKINLKAGEDKFGRVISDLLRGLGLTANFMLVIEQALQTVGVTMSEYKNMKNIDQLRAAAVSKGINLTGDDLHKFNDALELLVKNLSRVKYTPVVGSYSGSSTDSTDSMDNRRDNIEGSGLVAGAYAGGIDYPRSTMDKRVEDRKKLRNLIYSTFVRQLNDVLDKFVGALDVLSMKVGTDIPPSDQLDGFRQALTRISVDLSRKRQIYLALIGYYNDALSKSKRDQVVGEMKMVSSFIDSILEMPAYRSSAGYFQAVQVQIKALLDLIGKYSDEISAKFGRGEDSERDGAGASPVSMGYSPSPYAGPGSGASPIGDVTGSYASPIGAATGDVYGAASPIGDVTGHSSVYGADEKEGSGLNMGLSPLNVRGGEDQYGGGDGDAGDIPAPKFRATKTLDDAVRQFDYKYRVAQIRGNLARSGAELSHYGEKYEKLVANSIAEVLKEEQKKYNALSKVLADEMKATGLTDVQKKELEQAKVFLDGQWEAKKKFWAVTEAMDSYMKAFTNGFVNNPNDIKDIRAILDDIEVIRDWYSERSGNQLASVFDHFPSVASNNADGTTGSVSPSKALTEPDDSSHYYQSLEKTGEAPGNPLNVAEPKKGVDARATLKSMLSSMTALKNLLSVFVHFGSKFGGNDLNKVTFLTPAQIYNNLVDYLQASAFQQGYGVAWTVENDAISTAAGSQWVADGAATNAANGTGLTTAGGLTPPAAGSTNPGQIRRHWGVWMRSTDGAQKARETPFNFKTEDEYFVLIMKSIAAKILTVTGMYDVMDRPYEFNGITPIRMIMGGDDSMPKVEEGAVALYLRLPLLCQFWRTIFNFDERNGEGVNTFPAQGQNPYSNLPFNDKTLKISMVPDMDGTFAGLIRLMFRKNRYLDTSAYSDDDIKSIIRECNMIYQKMSAKHSQNTVMETIYELIAEVNRRYGIVTKDDRDKYESEFGYSYDYAKGNQRTADGYTDRYSRDPDPADIALLPGEDEEAIPRPSGAERLLEGTDWSRSEAAKNSKYKVDLQHRDLVRNFRCVIDKFFENPREEYSFNGAIKSTQQKLKRETRDEERFKIVASLVRGVDVYSKVDGIKYLIFHETVVAGLNVLSGLHSMLSRFQARAQLLDINWLVERTQAYMVKLAGVAGAAGQATSTGLSAALLDDYNASGNMNVDVATLINKLLGENEADLCNSGRAGAPRSIRPTDDMRSANVLRFNNNTVGAVGANYAISAVANSTHHLAGVLNGLNASRLKEIFENKRDPNHNNVLCFFRYLINRELAMKELLETLFGLSSDLQGLVSVRIDDGKLYLNTGGLKGLVNELFDQVSYFLELLRPHVRTELIDRYTSKLNLGSLYWLQEQLLEKIVIGRPAQTVPVAGAPAKVGYSNLDDQMRALSDTYGFLTREFEFSGNGLQSAAPSTVTPVASRNSFDKVFASLIFYDGERPGSGLLPSKDAPTWDNANKAATYAPKLVSWATDPYEALHLAGPPGAQVLDTRFAARFYQLYSWKDELTLNRSALFVFNQLVAKFIQCCYDPGQKKIYKGLIDKFANGTFNRAITDHRFTYPDVAPAFVSKFSGPEDLKLPPNLVTTSAAIRGIADGTGLRTIIENYLGNLNPNTPIDPTFGLGPAGGRQVAAGGNGVAELTAMEAVVNNTLIPSVIAAFPYSQNMGDGTISAREKANRIKMFCDMLWAVWAMPVGADAATQPVILAENVSKVLAQLKSSNVYSTGRASELSYLVKGDELASLSAANISAAAVPGPTYEEKNILFARRDPIDGVNSGNSSAKLGIAPPGGNASPPADDLNRITAFGNRADPDGDHVLFTSLAVIIRNMVHTRIASQTQNLVYLTENIADVPLYMKEKLRANLPAFKNLFRELINRCEFLKKFLMRKEMNIERYFAGGAAPSHNPWPWVLVDPVTNSDSAKDRFSSILDTIVRGSQTLIEACDSTLKEVGDDPKYLELYSGSIRDYRSQYGVDPLMPVSSLLAVLQNVEAEKELDFFPIHSLGELHFKHMYSGRSLLQNMAAQPTADSVPGWTQTVESFNLMVDGRLQAEAGNADGMLKALVKGIRYLYDLKRVKGLLTPHLNISCVGDLWNDHRPGNPRAVPATFAKLFSEGAFTRGNLIGAAPTRYENKLDYSIVESGDDKFGVKPAFATRNPLTRVVMLTESSNKDDQLKYLVEYISGDDKKPRTHSLAVQNIIDLNVIPINVHALMREVPLVNLYNYAYTYERMLVELFYGASGKTAAELIKSLCADDKFRPNSPKDMLVKMLIEPYYDLYGGDEPLNDIDSRSRAEYVQGMLLGATGEEGLGRPKFLSDQIYGKAIFGELYTSRAEMSDMGPAVRYSRTLLRGVVRGRLSPVLVSIINHATGAGGKFIRLGAGSQFTEKGARGTPSGNELASIIIDYQKASIDELATKIERMTNPPVADVTAVAGPIPDQNAANKAARYAIAILAKTVGTAFLWAVDAVISGKMVTPANAKVVINEIIDSLGQLTYANGKLNTNNMRTAAINNGAKSAFDHILDTLDSVSILAGNNPIAAGANVRNAASNAAEINQFVAAVAQHRDNAGAISGNAVGQNLHTSRGNVTGDNISLHYLENGVMKTAAPVDKASLVSNGRARFDTVLIRNLVFIVNLYRSVRMKLQQDLTYSKDIVTKSLPITRAQLTEFSGNAGWKGREESKNLRYE